MATDHDHKRARVAVIGGGWWATQFHLPALEADGRVDLEAVVDTDPVRLAAAVERFRPRRSYSDHRELLAAGEVDAAVIAVPHAFHYEIARAALDAGVHVLVEKPMVLNAREAWDLTERADGRGIHLVVGHTLQFTSHARSARELVQSGAIGELQLVSAVFSSVAERLYQGLPEEYSSAFAFDVTGPRADTYSDPALSGGGQGQTQLTHVAAMLTWVCGAGASQVFALMGNFGLRVDLADAISFRMKNGAVGSICGTGGLRPGQPQQKQLTYYGDEGFLCQDLANGLLMLHRNDGQTESYGILSEAERFPAHSPARCLVDLILGTGENDAPAAAAARAVELLEAAYRSATEARPVQVDELT